MNQAEELQKMARMLHSQCAELIIKFVYQYPDIPAQTVMIGLGELLIQFSVAQVGKAETLHLLDSLRDAVERFDIFTA